MLVAASLPVWGEEGPHAAAAYSAGLETRLPELVEAVQKQLVRLHDVAQMSGSASAQNVRGTVTSDLARSFADVPAEVVDELRGIQASLRTLLLETARQVDEQHRSAMLSDPEFAGLYGSLPAAAADRLNQIAAAVGDNNAAVASIYLAVQVFAEMNNQLIVEAKNARSPMRKRELYIMQASRVYEIANIVTDVIGQARLQGLDALRDLRDENQSRIARRLAEINLQRRALREDILAEKLSDESARRMERSYVQIIEANQEVASAWDQLLASAAEQRNFFDGLSRYVSQIEQKQQLAKFQLDTLRDVLMIGGSLEPLDRVDERLMPADQLPLLVLDTSTVLRLIGGGGAANAIR